MVELLLGPLDPVTPNLQTAIDTVLGKDGQQGKVRAAGEGRQGSAQCDAVVLVACSLKGWAALRQFGSNVSTPCLRCDSKGMQGMIVAGASWQEAWGELGGP